MMKMAKRGVVILVVFFVPLGLEVTPGVMDVPPQQDDWEGKLENITEYLMVLRFQGVCFPLTHKKHGLNQIWLCWWYFW